MVSTSFRSRTALSVSLLGIVTALASPSLADNPIVQTSYTADPAPMVHEGRLYLYTSHDEDVTVKDFYTMNDWRLYSTMDMVNWTDHGSVASYKTFSWGTDNAWAPQGIARNGKYYLYVPLNNNTGAKIGVGVATTPLGPFKDAVGKELAQNGTGNIDPTVFVDDDGQAYMYWGNGTLRYVKLNSDMISTSGSITNVSMNSFVEGPWFYKREALYYLVYAAGSGNEKISYATSSSPTGPWTYRGDVMAAGSIFTNHPGVVDYKGHSYFFYHNGALPGGGTFTRSVCVEEFTYGSDGSIPKLTMSTTGPAAVATLNPFEQVEAETIASSKGLKTEVCTDAGGGINVNSISNGDYIKVKAVDFLDGVTAFDARVSSSGSNAKIELRIDSEAGTLLGTCDVSGASAWTTKNCVVSGGSGKHDLFLKFTGGSGDLFKFNWWKFTGPTTPTTGAGGAGSGGAGAGGEVGRGGSTAQSSGRAGSGPIAQGGGAGGRIATTSGVGGRSTATGSTVSAPAGGTSSGGSSEGLGGRVLASGGSTTGSTSVGGTGSASIASGGTPNNTVNSNRGGQTASLSEARSGGSVGSDAASSKGGTVVTQATGTSTNSVTDANPPSNSGCSCRNGAGGRGDGMLGAMCFLTAAFLVRRRERNRCAR